MLGFIVKLVWESGENENKYRLFTIDSIIRNHCFRVNCSAKSNVTKTERKLSVTKRLSSLEIQLQTVENDEKMELAAKLAEAERPSLLIQNLVN